MAMLNQPMENNAQNGTSEKQVIVVMIPLPAQGHLNQLLHLSRLISSYSIPVHYVGTTTHNRQAKARVHGWDPLSISNIHFHEFPLPSFHSPPPNPNAPTKFPSQLIPLFYATLELRDHISTLLRDLSTTAKRLIVIHDSLMAYVAQDVPTIPNAESYFFHSCSVFTIYTWLWEFSGKPNAPEPEVELLKDHHSMEGCFPPEIFELTKLNQESNKLNSGNLYNTCREIEGRYFDLVAQARLSETDRHWAIGPFNPLVISEEKSSNNRHKCLEWLDKQHLNSVIFVSFGTTTSFSDEEINELAVGLEKSGQRFMWVLRDADKGDVFTGETRRARLPEGYEERIEGRGIIIRDWAPQLEILAHSSTGGFMSHCGWNSTMESITMGVPIAAWPMHSDQPRNTILITQLLKIGIAVSDWAKRDEVVKSETIENVVRRLMDSSEGEEIRERASKLSEDVKKSVEKGGQSHSEMESFIAHIQRKILFKRLTK